MLLVPKASGLDALVWVLPAVGFVIGVTGLGRRVPTVETRGGRPRRPDRRRPRTGRGRARPPTTQRPPRPIDPTTRPAIDRLDDQVRRAARPTRRAGGGASVSCCARSRISSASTMPVTSTTTTIARSRTATPSAPRRCSDRSRTGGGHSPRNLDGTGNARSPWSSRPWRALPASASRWRARSANAAAPTRSRDSTRATRHGPSWRAHVPRSSSQFDRAYQLFVEADQEELERGNESAEARCVRRVDVLPAGSAAVGHPCRGR